MRTGKGNRAATATSPAVTSILTAEEVLVIAESKADQASTAYGRQQAAVIGAVYITDLADFRHAVRHAATGAVVHVAGCMAQFDHYTCIGELTDGVRLYSPAVQPGIEAAEWAAIVD
jgi:hypothetical protein